MSMYYVKQGGRVTGPFDRDEILRRISLNVVRSLDRISSDGVTWTFVKDSGFWRIEGEGGGQVQVDMPFVSSMDSPTAPHPVPFPTRLRR